jgi:hypothetical protein
MNDNSVKWGKLFGGGNQQEDGERKERVNKCDGRTSYTCMKIE